MKRPVKIFKWTLFFYRCFVVFALYCIGFAASQIFNSDLKEAEQKARKKIVNSENFRRGDILSADGKPLAPYYPEYMLFADFGVRIGKYYTVDKNKVTAGTKTEKPVKLDTFRINIYKEFAKSLAKTLGGNADDYYRELLSHRIKAENAKKAENGSNKAWYTENVIKKKINVFQRDAILGNPHLEKRGRNVTGIYAKETGRRMYPFGDNFAHSTIGVIRDTTVSGIENIYNEELKNGNDILTTIDTQMQDICETVLQDAISGNDMFVGGAAILMEVATGDIKAMANVGAYYMEENRVIHDIYNNATKAALEPGSTFKAVSLMLALETGKVTLSDKFSTVKWRNRKYPKEHMTDSVLTVSRIIEGSDNVGTGNMVDKAFDRNIDKFVQAIKSLKIIEGIENMDDTRPSINPDKSKESMLKLSHGYQITMAPVHILSFYNAIANGGVMVKPRLVRGLIRRTTGEIEIFKPEIINKSICSESTLDSVRLTLSNVVGRGSARRIARSVYGIVGKTGTSNMWLESTKTYEARDLSSFCGYFPEKNPKYSCIVVLYTKFLTPTEKRDFSASSTAVPLFGKISDKIYAVYFSRKFTPAAAPTNIPVIKSTKGENLSIISKELGLQIDAGDNAWVRIDTANRLLNVSGISVKRGVVPDVTGMGLRDAVFLLENRGLKVSYSGVGAVVKQSIEQGAAYNPGQNIHLTLGQMSIPE
ncbi:MAG: PASTA domain-containing protein [Tannerella sp.]|jgi:cell division protein FtsI (penicillin-binding protein 3)|nr:PASTA domain-containing protein [Tannerella sp.]